MKIFATAMAWPTNGRRTASFRFSFLERVFLSLADSPCFHSHSCFGAWAPVPVGVLLLVNGAALSGDFGVDHGGRCGTPPRDEWHVPKRDLLWGWRCGWSRDNRRFRVGRAGGDGGGRGGSA